MKKKKRKNYCGGRFQCWREDLLEKCSVLYNTTVTIIIIIIITTMMTITTTTTTAKCSDKECWEMSIVVYANFDKIKGQ